MTTPNEAYTWDRQKIKEVLETLAQLPDFDQMLFPDSWAKEFDIPITQGKCYDLRAYMASHKQTRLAFQGKVEEVPLKDTRVRTELPEDKIELKVHTVPCNSEDQFGLSDQTTESTVIKQQENPAESSKEETPLPDAS